MLREIYSIYNIISCKTLYRHPKQEYTHTFLLNNWYCMIIRSWFTVLKNECN